MWDMYQPLCFSVAATALRYPGHLPLNCPGIWTGCFHDPKCQPMPPVPDASFHAQITQMVWFKSEAPSAGRFFQGFSGALTLRSPNQVFLVEDHARVLPVPQNSKSIADTIQPYIRRLVVLGSRVWQMPSFQLLPKLLFFLQDLKTKICYFFAHWCYFL